MLVLLRYRQDADAGQPVVPKSSSSRPWDREQQERSGHGEKGQIPLLRAAASGFSLRWEQLPSAYTSPEPASS